MSYCHGDGRACILNGKECMYGQGWLDLDTEVSVLPKQLFNTDFKRIYTTDSEHQRNQR